MSNWFTVHLLTDHPDDVLNGLVTTVDDDHPFSDPTRIDDPVSADLSAYAFASNAERKHTHLDTVVDIINKEFPREIDDLVTVCVSDVTDIASVTSYGRGFDRFRPAHVWTGTVRYIETADGERTHALYSAMDPETTIDATDQTLQTRIEERTGIYPELGGNY